MKSANPRLAAQRRRKEELMPEVVKRDRRGKSSRAIADELGIGKSTVDRWLRGRQAAAVAAALGTPKGAGGLAARYNAIFRKAVRGWNRSAKDKEVRVDEETKTTGPDGIVKTKTVHRTETRVANPACLTRALEALKGLSNLHFRAAERDAGAMGPATEAPAPANELTLEDMKTMTNQELYELELRDAAKAVAAGQTDVTPVPTQEELRAIPPEEQAAILAQLRAEMAAEAAEERERVSRETPSAERPRQAAASAEPTEPQPAADAARNEQISTALASETCLGQGPEGMPPLSACAQPAEAGTPALDMPPTAPKQPAPRQAAAQAAAAAGLAHEERIAAAVNAARRAGFPPAVLAEIAAGRVELKAPPCRPQNAYVVNTAWQAGLPPSVVTEIAAGRLKMVTKKSDG
jgi:hypothetical protein